MTSPKNDIHDYVLVYNAHTQEECNSFIEELEKSNWSPHTWYQNRTNIFADRKDFSVQNNVEVQNKMREGFISAIKHYFKTVTSDITDQFNFSAVRFNKYDTGESIKHHVDHIHSIFDGKRKGIPIMSFVGVFNDDYEGGEFILAGKEYPLKAGDVIMFPSVFLYPHEVKPITSGVRYSWVLWAYQYVEIMGKSTRTKGGT